MPSGVHALDEGGEPIDERRGLAERQLHGVRGGGGREGRLGPFRQPDVSA